jgi:hypothetical protein
VNADPMYGGEGRVDREAIDACTCLVHRGNGHGTLERQCG